MLPERDRAIEELAASHRDWMARLGALSRRQWEAPLTRGSWRVRDLAAHVAACDHMLVADLEALPRGTMPPWLAGDEEASQERNAGEIERRAGMTAEQQLAEMGAARGRVLDAIAALDEARFTAQTPYTSPRRGRVEVSPAWLCGVWLEHDRAHMAELPTLEPV